MTFFPLDAINKTILSYYESVSYTHLVKRSLLWAFLIGSISWQTGPKALYQREEKRLKAWFLFWRSLLRLPDGLLRQRRFRTVSYTHLDVYKRQVGTSSLTIETEPIWFCTFFTASRAGLTGSPPKGSNAVSKSFIIKYPFRRWCENSFKCIRMPENTSVQYGWPA